MADKQVRHCRAEILENTPARVKILWRYPCVDVSYTNLNPDACIELLNSKSEYKVFAMFQGGFIKPWGNGEQSKYTKDPFAGPWNHWPMHLVPSDGRFAVASDRVTHFALGANDQAPKFGSMVLYGFSNQPISTLLPVARSWLRPPAITAIAGCTTSGYKKETREFSLVASKPEMAARIAATAESPMASLCLSIKNWGHAQPAIVKVAGGVPKEVRQGTVVDTTGTRTLLVWLDLNAIGPVSLTISGANPQPNYPAKE